MLGKRSDQRGLFEADHLYLDLVGRDSFYGRLAGLRGQLFRDEDFAVLYCRDNGRSSVPPSLLATALLLQAHDKVSDAEAHRRATVDLSWKVALGVEVEVRPFAQSTLQHFRAQLVLHAQMRELFLRSLELARGAGLCPLPGGQCQGHGGDRLWDQPTAREAFLGRDCGRCGPPAGGGPGRPG